MSSFYMTLPSNSSMSHFPNNTLAEYTTRLPQPFDLAGEWEIGNLCTKYNYLLLLIANECYLHIEQIYGNKII